MSPKPKAGRWLRAVVWVFLLAVVLPTMYWIYTWATIPRYEGKTFHHWMDLASQWSDLEERKAGREALLQMGAKAAPYLLEEYRQSTLVMPLYRSYFWDDSKRLDWLFRNQHHFPEWLRRKLMGNYDVRFTRARAAKDCLISMGTNLVVVEAELISLLEEAQGSFKHEVLGFLNGMGNIGTNASPHVARLLYDEDRELRNAAAYTLGRLARSGDSHAPEVVLAVREGRIPAATGVRTLVRMGASPALVFPELGRQLLVPAEQLDAASCIIELGPEKELLLPAMVEALKAEDPRFRVRLLEAFDRFHAQGAGGMAGVMEALGDDYYYVRAEAARALGRMGPAAARAIPHLRELTNDPHPDVPIAAAAALRLIEAVGEPKGNLE